MTIEQRLTLIEAQNREIIALLRVLLPPLNEPDIFVEAERRSRLRKKIRKGEEICQEGTE